MWSELRAGLQTVKIHQKLAPLILNQINVTSLTLIETSSAPAEESLTVYQSFVQHVHKLRLLKENCDTISTAVIYSFTDSGRHFNMSGTSMKSVLGLKSNG